MAKPASRPESAREPEASGHSIAERLADELQLDRALEPYRELIADRPAEGVTAHLDDFSAIPFLDGIAGVEEYQHRARLRADDGDLFVTTTAPDPAQEPYFSDRLSLGRPTLLEVATGSSGPLAVATACTQPGPLLTLSELASSAGTLTIEPYMAIEAVWALAERVAARTEARVQVLGPPPPITWIANDKSSFDHLVRRALGPEWLAPTRRARTAAELTAALLDLADAHPTVALKRLRCASAMGNLVFDSGRLLTEGRDKARDRVDGFLRRTGWDGAEDVLAVAWIETEHSPSSQWWIPPLGTGEPRLDGIYEQILEGDEKVFLGSRPSELPEPVHRRIAGGGRTVATVLQRLGYIGRCSFDHLAIDIDDADPRVLFTECNGRWGGTSTPMSLVDRLLAQQPDHEPPPGPFGPRRPAYRAQDFAHPRLIGTTFGQILERVGERLYDPATGDGTFVFYNVGPLRAHGKLDVIALAESRSAADDAIERELPELLGLRLPGG